MLNSDKHHIRVTIKFSIQDMVEAILRMNKIPVLTVSLNEEQREKYGAILANIKLTKEGVKVLHTKEDCFNLSVTFEEEEVSIAVDPLNVKAVFPEGEPETGMTFKVNGGTLTTTF